MGRRVKPYLFAAGIGLAALLLMTCFNPFDIIAELETEVKIANNKFLIVESITPAKNATGVQPGSRISTKAPSTPRRSSSIRRRIR